MFIKHTFNKTVTTALLIGLLALSTAAVAHSASDATLTHNERAAQNVIAGTPLRDHAGPAANEATSLVQNESSAKATISGAPISARSANVVGNATLTHNERAAQNAIVATPNHLAALAGAVAKVSPQH